MKITVWNEFFHEKTEDAVRAVYPNGIHECIADFLREAGHEVTTATLDMPECGLTDEVLDNTDVLFWWGHMAHHKVPDEIAERVARKVRRGMGLVVLHSGHASKVFSKLCGTESVELKWRESGDKQILWVVEPNHPITKGLDDRIVLEQEETYGEHFMIPTPDELVFISWFSGGEVFRSGCVFNRGQGKIFYFQPGHETFPTYYNPEVQTVLKNAAEYVYNPMRGRDLHYGHFQSIL